MNDINPWLLLRGVESEQETGLRLVQQAYTLQQGPSQAMELGVALLWLGKYASAWEHFHARIRFNGQIGDNEYGMAGVAKWCLGEYGEAVAQWRAGLETKYARASGLGVRMPLLLFFASVLKPEIADRSFAVAQMLKKVKDRRIQNWPGPIVKLMLDQIGEAEFQNHCRTPNQQDTSDREWLAKFYRSVIDTEQRGLSAFKDSMRELTDMRKAEWQKETVLLSRIWNEEYFLARCEAT